MERDLLDLYLDLPHRKLRKFLDPFRENSVIPKEVRLGIEGESITAFSERKWLIKNNFQQHWLVKAKSRDARGILFRSWASQITVKSHRAKSRIDECY